MSFVDDLLKAAEVEQAAQIDEFGTPYPDDDPTTGRPDPTTLVDYLVERAIKNTTQLNEPYANTGLYMYRGHIYLGNEELEEDLKTLYALTKYLTPLTTPVRYMFWVKLKESIPHLDKRYFQVSEWTFWDNEEGRLVKKEEVDAYIASKIKGDR